MSGAVRPGAVHWWSCSCRAASGWQRRVQRASAVAVRWRHGGLSSFHTAAAALYNASGITRSAERRSWLSSSRDATVSVRSFNSSPPRAEAAPAGYDFHAVEAKWKQRWAEHAEQERATGGQQHNAHSQSDKPPYYCLSMFPYPSGSLHMGHVRVYCMSDVLARFHRHRGFSVVHPMGWDAFGLPAENAAMQRGVAPQLWTQRNVASMKAQLQSLSLSFDWHRELNTSQPAFYRHTQHLFLLLHRAGLAYQKEALVNYDPVDGTVLANEQVDSQGRSWRSGAQVQRLRLRQWWLRLGHYRDEMLTALDGLQGWGDSVKAMQRNWIGKSEGTMVRFRLLQGEGEERREGGGERKEQETEAEAVSVFTTRVDTLYGVTYIVLAPEHELIDRALQDGRIAGERAAAVADYRKQAGSRTDVQRRTGNDKSGVWSGLYAEHPLTGGRLPVFLSEYVLAEYGTGAVMGVPAHDERDFAFATQLQLPIVPVVQPPQTAAAASSASPDAAASPSLPYTGDGLLINSGPFSSTANTSASSAITALLSSLRAGAAHTDYRLRDWLVSRQRYWGTPIPIIHCAQCGAVPVPESQLPVLLPELDFTQVKGGGSPLQGEEARAWRECACPSCGGRAERETDTLDTFVDSSWYFLRYLSPDCGSFPFQPEAVAPYLPVSVYVGGVEHAILHLLYARFMTRFLYHQRLLPEPEPFRSLLTQGMVQGRTFRHPVSGAFIPPELAEEQDGEYWTQEADGSRQRLEVVWEKMSKSKRNGVEPDSCIARYGADTVRLFVLFKAPPEKALDWDERAIAGQSRWLGRLHALLNTHAAAMQGRPPLPLSASQAPPPLLKLRQETETTVREVTTQLQLHIFNVALALLMKHSNTLAAFAAAHPALVSSSVFHSSARVLARLLAPFAPHFAAEMWTRLKEATGERQDSTRWQPDWDVHQTAWPEIADEQADAEAGRQVEVSVVVGGRRVGSVLLADDLLDGDEERVAAAVREDAAVGRALQGKQVSRVMVKRIKERGALVSFVV